jgi:FAD/FMN-containing dehydrogenase
MDLIAQLRTSLGANAILTDTADKAPFETDWRHLHSHPSLCVALPKTTAQVAATIQLCAAVGVKIVPQGGNTSLVAGAVATPGPPQLILSLNRMNKILSLDPVNDTITVQSGATLQAVQQAAAAANRLFPVSLAAEGTAQIGGVISTNAGGIQVLSYGSMRAQVLGLEVVLADGRIWDGMRALRKDNTGFDLKHLFIGGEGMLGIITAAVLRLHPAATGHATALIGVASLPAGLDIFKKLQADAGPALTACEFFTSDAMALGLAHLPGARSPFASPCYILAELSAHAPDQTPGQAHGETPEEQLLASLEPLIENGALLDAVVAKSEAERSQFWALREALSDGELAAGGSVKHDIAVPIGDMPAVVNAIEAMIADKFPGFRPNIFGHLGDGNLHINIRPPAGLTLADIADQKAAITEYVEAIAVAHRGSFSAEHAIGQMRLAGMAAHKSIVELDLMRAVKTALDPTGLFNPGKMLPSKMPPPL